MDNQERWYLDNLPLEGAVIADVGANVGRLSQFFRDHGGPGCRVVSIEPDPDNLAALAERIAAAGADNWTVAACAVSSGEGRVWMRSIDVAYGRNSVVTARGGHDAREVICRPLVDLVPDATVVKVDIEGHEYAVLPSAVPALAAAKAWAVELHMVEGHPLGDTLKLFADHGFGLLAAGRKRDAPDGVWVNVPITPALGWDDIPGTGTTIDRVPGVFKMLHVIARR